jgi:hypothetical protein
VRLLLVLSLLRGEPNWNGQRSKQDRRNDRCQSLGFHIASSVMRAGSPRGRFSRTRAKGR